MKILKFFDDLECKKEIEDQNLNFERLPLVKDRKGQVWKVIPVKNTSNFPVRIRNVKTNDDRVFIEAKPEILNPQERGVLRMALVEDADLSEPLESLTFKIEGEIIHLPQKRSKIEGKTVWQNIE